MKFGIREAVDVVFKATDARTIGSTNFAKGEPVIYFDSLKTSTTEGAATTVYAQGGKGNPRLIAWEGDKTITFTFEDAVISKEGMAVLTGAGLINGTVGAPIRVHRTATAVGTFATGKLTVDLTEAIGEGETLVTEDIFGFVVDGNGEIIERLGVGTGTVNALVFDTIATADANVFVDFYVAKTTGITEITIEANKFAGYYYIEADTLFRRQSDGRDLPAQIIIPNAKIQTNFTFAMSPSGDPSTFTFTADAFPGTVKGSASGNKVMYAMQLTEE